MPNISHASTKTSRFDVYNMITEEFIAALEGNTIPWRKSWTTGLPKNLITKREYHGINILLLGLRGQDEYYLTFKQAQFLGGSIRRGAESIPIVYWKINEQIVRDEKTGEQVVKTYPILRYYRVFGISQTVGLDKHIPKGHPNPPIHSCQEVIDENAPRIEYGLKPCYRPSTDTIRIPNRSEFFTSEDYYSTLFHELAHWTGHASRLDRYLSGLSPFRMEDYSREELVAEMTASFLCSSTGIRNTRIIEDEIAYIQSWIRVLKEDTKALIQAGMKAKQATAFLLKEDDAEEKKKPATTSLSA